MCLMNEIIQLAMKQQYFEAVTFGNIWTESQVQRVGVDGSSLEAVRKMLRLKQD